MNNPFFTTWPEWHCQRCNVKAIEWANNEHCYGCCKKDGCKCYWPEKPGQPEYLGKEAPRIVIDVKKDLAAGINLDE